MKILSLAAVKQLYRLVSKPGKYLESTGWLRSAIARRPMDSEGRPIPWLSYPFIDFISGRLNDGMLVVEFGAGNSTLFFASKVKRVFSVESNELWVKDLAPQLPNNAEVSYQSYNPADSMQYVTAADSQLAFADIVLVDGPETSETLKHVAKAIGPKGVIALDNADREQYQESASSLLMMGYRRLDFVGMCPGAARKSVTALFYRDGNCLGV